MKAGDMTDGIFLIHIVDALQETIDFTAGLEGTSSWAWKRRMACPCCRRRESARSRLMP